MISNFEYFEEVSISSVMLKRAAVQFDTGDL